MKKTHGMVVNTLRLPIPVNRDRERIGVKWQDAIVAGVKLVIAQHDDMVAAHGPQQGYRMFRDWLLSITKA